MSDFNETSVFSTVFRKILKHKISRKSVQWEPNCSMQTDGRTENTKLILAFRNFANAPKNCTFCPHSAFVCFVFISEQTATFALYDKLIVFLQPRWKEFTCAVRNWSSNKKKVRASSLQTHLAIYYSPVTHRFLHFTLYTVMPCHSIVLRHWTQQIFKF